MKNPLPLDWPLLAEMGRASARQISVLDNSVGIIMDREEGKMMAKLAAGEKYSMPSVSFVLSNWQLIDEGEYYDIYRDPSRNKKNVDI